MTVRMKTSLVLTLVCGVFGLAATAMLGWQSAWAAEATPAAANILDSGAHGWGFIAAALATGLSSLGAGFAVANVGAAAVGALAEKPELLGRALILVGLSEGIAIYGLIVSILILNRLG